MPLRNIAMEKFKRIIATLLLCLSIFDMIPSAYADKDGGPKSSGGDNTREAAQVLDSLLGVQSDDDVPVSSIIDASDVGDILFPEQGADVKQSDDKKKSPTDGAKEDAEEAESSAGDQAEVQGEQPKEPVVEETPTPEQPEVKYPKFAQTQTKDGVVISVTAAKGVFPEGSSLLVKSVSKKNAKKVEKAVQEERSDDVNVVSSYVFDISVLDKDGNEIQPKDGKLVNVSFTLEDVLNKNLDAQIYHVQESADGLSAEKLATKESEDTVSAKTDGFSFYQVEFTYGSKQYVLHGGASVPLKTILEEIGLSGDVETVTSSAPDLFSVEKRDGEWMVSANEAFSTTESLLVTIDGVEYSIVVTDAQDANGVDYVNHPPSYYKARAASWFRTEANFCAFMQDVAAWRDDSDTPSSAKGTTTTRSSPGSGYMVYLPPDYKSNDTTAPFAYELIVTVARLNDTAADTITRAIGTVDGVAYNVKFRDVYDYMITHELCRPFIVVSIPDMADGGKIRSNFDTVMDDVHTRYKTFQHYYEHISETNCACAAAYRLHQMIYAGSKSSIIMTDWGATPSSGSNDSQNYPVTGWKSSADYAYYLRYVATAPGATYATSDLWKRETKNGAPTKEWVWSKHGDNFLEMLQIITSGIIDVHKDVPECPCQGPLSLAKKSSSTSVTSGNSNYSLSGAKYAIYASKANANADTNRIETITTDANGNATTTKDYTYGKNYFIKEVTASKGYQLDDTVHTVSLDKNGNMTGDTSFKEVPITGKITITKVSDTPAISDDNTNYKYTATYGVYSDAACTTLVKSIKLTAGTNKGTGTVTGLPLGTYYIKEIYNPLGFKIDTSATSGISITATATSKSKTVEEVPVSIKIKITKKSSNETVTSGNDNYKYNAVYGVYSDAECTTLVKRITLNATTGEGTVANLPIADNYWVKEITAPEGFTLSTAIKKLSFAYVFDTVTASGLTVGALSTTTGGTVSSSTRLRTGYIYLDAGTYYLQRQNEDLEVRRFEYDSSKTFLQTEDDFVDDTARNYFTLANDGYVRFVFKKKDDSAITTSDFATTENIRSYQTAIEMTDAPKTGSITITKTSSDTSITNGNTAYKYNAVYGIYSKSTCTAASLVQQVTLTSGTNKGTATVSGLPLGTYYVKEIAAPDGFSISTDVSAGITLTATALTKSVGMTDTPKTGSITITKVSNSPAISDDNTNYKYTATYGVYSDADCTNLVKSIKLTAGTNQGTGTVTGLPLGTYYVKEIYNPTGFKINASATSGIAITAAATSKSVTVKEVPVTIRIKITKKSSNETVTLGNSNYKYNAVYGVYADADCTTLVKQITLNSSGVGTVTDLPLLSKYYVKEITAPAGFTLSTAVKTLTFAYTFDTVTASDLAVGAISTTGLNLSSTKRLRTGYIYLDAGTYYLQRQNTDLEVRRYEYDSNKAFIQSEDEFYDNTARNYFTLANDGYVRFVFKKKDDSDMTAADFATNEAIRSYQDAIEMTDAPKTGSITITKTSSDTSVTDGNTAYKYNAVYGIYSNQACTNEVERITLTSGTNKGTGTVSGLPLGTYYVKEITAPAGFNISTAVSAGISITNANAGTTQTVGMTDSPKTGSITITKVSSDPSVSDGNSAYQYTAKYGVYSDSACTQLVKDITLTNGTNKGTGTVTGLPLGKTYYVKEITAPTGFSISTEVSAGLALSVSAPTKSVTMTDTPKTGKITITKTSSDPSVTDGNSNYMYNAKYGVYSSSSCTAASLVKEITLTNNASANKGTGTVSGLPLGTYYIKEITAPAGFNISTTVSAGIEITSTTAKTYATTDVPKTGSITITKKSAQPSISDGDTYYNYTATYGVYSDSACTQLVDQITLTNDKPNNRGTGTVTGLPLGTYYVKEIKAPGGFFISTTTSAGISVTSSSLTKSVTMTDEPILITIRIKKTSTNHGISDGNTAYKYNAVYGIYNDADCTDLVRSVTLDSETNMGYAIVRDLPLWNRYYVKEITAPAGFELSTQKKYQAFNHVEKAITSADLVQGGISTSTGGNATSANAIRTDYIPVEEGTFRLVTHNSDLVYWRFVYDTNKTLVSKSSGWLTESTAGYIYFNVDEPGYIRFAWKKAAGGALTPAEFTETENLTSFEETFNMTDAPKTAKIKVKKTSANTSVTTPAAGNPNLLTNWSFTPGVINSNGQTTYTGNATECVDDWIIRGDMPVTVTNKGLKIDASTTLRGIFQVVDEDLSKWAGKTVVLSALISEFSGTGAARIGIANGTTNTAIGSLLRYKNFSGAGLVATAAYTFPADITGNYLNIAIYVPASESNNCSFTVSAIKFEEASSQTLAVQEDGVWVIPYEYNAKYGIYTDAACTNRVKTVTLTDMQTYGIGEVEGLPIGTKYYIKEMTAPHGFELNNTVYGPYTTSATSTVTVNAKDTPVGQTEFPISIKKESANEAATDGNPLYSLAGAVYGIYSSSSCTSASLLEQITTSGDGDASSENNYEAGTYYIKEITPSAGYLLDTTVHTITLGDDGEITGNTTFLEIPTNDPDRIVIRKATNAGVNLITSSSARFKVEYFANNNWSGTPDATWYYKTINGICRIGDENYLDTSKTSSARFRQDGEVIIPLGTLRITEDKAPTGYQAAGIVMEARVSQDSVGAQGTWHWVTTSGSVFSYTATEATLENESVKTTLTISKTVAGNLGDKSKEFTFTLHLEDEFGNPVTGNLPYTGTKSGTLEMNTSGNGTFTLQHDDEITISNVPVGASYTFTENNYAADGYTTTSTNASGTATAAGKTTQFTNRSSTTVPTGIAVGLRENILFASAFGILLTVAFLLTKKRRKHE